MTAVKVPAAFRLASVRVLIGNAIAFVAIGGLLVISLSVGTAGLERIALEEQENFSAIRTAGVR